MTPERDAKITATLGELETALLKVQHIRDRASAAYNRLDELRWEALKTLARPRPGDKENGLLDGVDLSSLEWAETVAAEQRAQGYHKRSARR